MALISVIIPTWNGLGMLQQAVASLRRGSRPPDEVVVVDNGSSDGTAEWAELEGLRVVRFLENRGFAAAVNAGLREATGDLLLVLNNDIHCGPQCVAALERAAAENPWAAWLAPKIVDWRGEQMECAGIGVRRDFFAVPIGRGDPPRQWDRPLEVFGASGGAALIRRELFEAVGFFAEEFFAYYEDVDFALRCRLAGYRCLFVPDAVVRHLGGATARRLGWRVAYLSARNELWTTVRCCPSALVAALAPSIVRGQLANLVTAAAERHFWATVAGKAAAVAGLGRQLQARRRIQATAVDPEGLLPWLDRPYREI